MTRERYRQWMAVWKWFRGQSGTPELESLHALLNEMWQQDRENTPVGQLAAYSQEFDIENDPDFQKFMRDLNANPPGLPPEE